MIGRPPKPQSRWSKYNIKICSCGVKCYRGNESGVCGTCNRKANPPWQGKKRLDIRKEHKRGNHYHYLGRLEYKLWRESVFKRDNYCCVMCGVRGVYLEADHLKSWTFYPDLRYEFSNGRTLCKECHKKTPNYKGRARTLFKKEQELCQLHTN